MAKTLFNAQIIAPADQPSLRFERLGRQWRSSLDRLRVLYRLWCCRTHERRLLSEMDDRMLADLGRTRGDIFGEIHKPFWRG